MVPAAQKAVMHVVSLYSSWHGMQYNDSYSFFFYRNGDEDDSQLSRDLRQESDVMVNNLAVTPVDSIYWLCGFKYTLSLHVNPWKRSQNNCSDCYSVPGTSRSNDQPDLIANNYAYEYMHTCMNEKDTHISSF